jgi:hypothetical protein
VADHSIPQRSRQLRRFVLREKRSVSPNV